MRYLGINKDEGDMEVFNSLQFASLSYFVFQPFILIFITCIRLDFFGFPCSNLDMLNSKAEGRKIKLRNDGKLFGNSGREERDKKKNTLFKTAY